MTARNRTRPTIAQLFAEWWLRNGSVFKEQDRLAWMAGYRAAQRRASYYRKRPPGVEI